MSLLEIICYVLVAIVGSAVVFVKRPINQIFVYSTYGLVLSLLFFVLHAPDVALSEISVGTVIIPLVVLITIMKTANEL
jgi:energy-converting hydrogenase B subunit D